MLEFEVQRCTRRCAKTQRELQPGELFYSELVAEGGQVVRYDYAAEAWSGETEHNVGWWKSRVPGPSSARAHWAPSDVMLHYFEELESLPDKRDERYIMALLLLRRRIVRLEETPSAAPPGKGAAADRATQAPARVEGGPMGAASSAGETLTLYSPRNEREYQVAVVLPTPARIREIQDNLTRLFFSDTKP
jgi:hypothetical protein